MGWYLIDSMLGLSSRGAHDPECESTAENGCDLDVGMLGRHTEWSLQSSSLRCSYRYCILSSLGLDIKVVRHDDVG